MNHVWPVITIASDKIVANTYGVNAISSLLARGQRVFLEV
jgi:hypothetical protein